MERVEERLLVPLIGKGRGVVIARENGRWIVKRALRMAFKVEGKEARKQFWADSNIQNKSVE